MARYHYKLEIVPGEGEILHDDNYWIFQQPNPMMLEEFRKILPDNNSWGETEEFRSKDNHSVLYIWWEKGNVFSVFVEFAPVDKGEDVFLDGILNLCKKYNYVLYSHASKIRIEPTKKELWKDFESSHSYNMYKDRLDGFH